MTKDDMERLWQVTGCVEPLRRVRWSDTPRALPPRRYSSPQDEDKQGNSFRLDEDNNDRAQAENKDGRQ